MGPAVVDAAKPVAARARQLAQTLAFSPEHERNAALERLLLQEVLRLVVETDGGEPQLLHRVDGAREVLLERDRHELERAGGRLRQRRIERRAVAARHHETAGSEHRARAQDGAHIVRVGDLIEHHERPAGIRGRRDFVQARLGQRLGLE